MNREIPVNYRELAAMADVVDAARTFINVGNTTNIQKLKQAVERHDDIHGLDAQDEAEEKVDTKPVHPGNVSTYVGGTAV